MKPTPSDTGVSARMAAQRRAGTEPEMALRRALFARGLRYRVGYPVPGARRCSIDVAFPRQLIAVFVDGCFWHRCPDHRTAPKANSDWWAAKLEANEARDRRVDRALEQAGWQVVRVWEHEPTDAALRRVTSALRSREHASKVTPS